MLHIVWQSLSSTVASILVPFRNLPWECLDKVSIFTTVNIRNIARSEYIFWVFNRIKINTPGCSRYLCYLYSVRSQTFSIWFQTNLRLFWCVFHLSLLLFGFGGHLVHLAFMSNNYTHPHRSKHIYTNTHARTHAHTYIHTHEHTHTHKYTHARTHADTQTNALTHTHTHTHTDTLFPQLQAQYWSMRFRVDL